MKVKLKTIYRSEDYPGPWRVQVTSPTECLDEVTYQILDDKDRVVDTVASFTVAELICDSYNENATTGVDISLTEEDLELLTSGKDDLFIQELRIKLLDAGFDVPPLSA